MATGFSLCGTADLDRLLGLLEDWHRADARSFDLGAARLGLARLLRDSSWGHAWIISQQGRPVGYAVLTFPATTRGVPPAYVAGLYLEPTARGRGLGRRTIGFLENVGRLLHVRVHHFANEGESKHAPLLYRRSGAGAETTFWSMNGVAA